MRRICNTYKIKNSFFIPYFPQGNGQVKSTNKIIIMILKNIIKDNHQYLHEYILYSLWAYCASICMPMDTTYFSLIYGTKVVIPLKLKITSLHVSLKDFILYEESRQAKLDQLTLLDERHINAIEHHNIYQEYLIWAFNKKVQPHEFHINDFILKENQQQSHLECSLCHKFSLNYLGSTWTYNILHLISFYS